MANVYRAGLSDGSACDITTDRHHAVSSIISGMVVGYVHKGRK